VVLTAVTYNLLDVAERLAVGTVPDELCKSVYVPSNPDAGAAVIVLVLPGPPNSEEPEIVSPTLNLPDVTPPAMVIVLVPPVSVPVNVAPAEPVTTAPEIASLADR